MSDQSDAVQFNYIYLLGELEQACRAHKPKTSSIRAGVKRGIDVPLHLARKAAFKAKIVVMQVIAKVSQRSNKIDDLKISADRLAAVEKELLRNIHNYTHNRTYADRPLDDIWPAPIPDGRILERLVSTTLGLASESRHINKSDVEANFQLSLQAAVHSVLVPALAWRILCELFSYQDSTREELLSAVVKKLEADPGVQRDFVRVKIDEREFILNSLILQRSWIDVLKGQACRMPHTEIVTLLCRELASRLKGKDSLSVRHNLFPSLTEAFGWGRYGAERIHSIELAWKKRQYSMEEAGKAIFSISRLKLLDAAHSVQNRNFADLVKVNLAQANKATASALSGKPALDAEMYAGMAFWLAHACFRRPMAYTFDDINAQSPRAKLRKDGEMADVVGSAPTQNTQDYDDASEHAARLLEYAYRHDNSSEDQKLLILRFLAGFATNPRYWRAPYVFQNAQRWVDEYKAAGGQKSLLMQMHARLMWQHAYSSTDKTRKELLHEALDGYHRCLDEAGDDFRNLDPEAPIHLFPEIAVLVGSVAEKKPQNTLAAIDFILSRNFSIYMDIDSERDSIEAGFKQAAAQPVQVASYSAR